MSTKVVGASATGSPGAHAASARSGKAARHAARRAQAGAGGFVESNSIADEQHWAASMLLAPVASPHVRVWTCARPGVALGRAQRRDPYMALRAKADIIDLCRRATGGGALLAGPWLLGTSVVLPAGHAFVSADMDESFRWFGQLHADWLAGFGIDAKCVPPAQARSDRSLAWACFGGLSPWDVEVSGRKIVALSQARTRNGVLLGSAVLVGPPPWALLCDVMGMWSGYVGMLARRTASCAQVMGRLPSTPVLGLALLHALEGALDQPEK
jgi:lipoate-protein ligase A